MKKRIHQIELFLKYPIEVQEEVFKKLISSGKTTEFGKTHGFSSIRTEDHFKQQVPISTYESLFPFIERIMKGEQNVLWPTEIKWFAKSSGTTNSKSKFIPVSQEALDDCHFKGGKDLLSIYTNNFPDTQMFAGKGLSIGGSHQINNYDPSESSYYGDVSAVIMKNLPLWAQIVRTPSLDIALMDKWEEKIAKMAEVTISENVTNMAGVPTWTLLLLERVLEITGRDHISEVWPNLEAFFHGAVAFGPYREIFNEIVGLDTLRYVETYNASEGFFGIQDTTDSTEMLLMLDYGIYYEFIPADEVNLVNPQTLNLGEVKPGVNYAIVISTNGGLWRYMIGDTIRFTNTSPYRFKLTGRTKHFINAFGEEVIIENAEEAITRAAHITKANVSNFTACPVYLGRANEQKGGHEWVIEFDKEPENLERFSRILDEVLRDINSDYDAKRYQDMALLSPIVHAVPNGTFYNWMKKRGKLGGQHKVPRLSNSREYVEDVLDMLNQGTSVTINPHSVARS